MSLDFKSLLGGTFNHKTLHFIDKGRWEFRAPDEEENSRIARQVRGHIFRASLDSTSDSGREALWERCWANRLQRAEEGGELTPDFLTREEWPMRLNGRFILPSSNTFEACWTAVLRSHLYEKYFAPAEVVHEFGCGSGHNLFALANQQRGKILHGYDWSPSAVRSLQWIRERYGIPIHGHRFNFFDPPSVMEMRSYPTGVLTIGALEQVGKNFQKFLSMLLASKPNIVVHVEPLIELYDAKDELDALAIIYHWRRKYLEGYLPALQVLEKAGEIEILELRRTGLGSFYHDPYVVLAWRAK